MEFKSFLSFITEGIGGMSGSVFVPGAKGGISTNTADQETGIPPEEDTDDENDRFNPSIINKMAAKTADGNVSYISKGKKTPGNSISTGRRIPDDELQEAEEPKEGGWYKHKRSGQVWQLNWLDTEDNEAVMVKSGGRPLTKRIKLKNFHKNWEPKILGEGGFGDNQVAGQPVFTQHVDKAKQGYQDSVFYDDDIDDHGEDCDCPECQRGSNDLVTRNS